MNKTNQKENKNKGFISIFALEKRIKKLEKKMILQIQINHTLLDLHERDLSQRNEVIEQLEDLTRIIERGIYHKEKGFFYSIRLIFSKFRNLITQ